jgi:hypothetical protein
VLPLHACASSAMRHHDGPAETRTNPVVWCHHMAGWGQGPEHRSRVPAGRMHASQCSAASPHMRGWQATSNGNCKAHVNVQWRGRKGGHDRHPQWHPRPSTPRRCAGRGGGGGGRGGGQLLGSLWR